MELFVDHGGVGDDDDEAVNSIIYNEAPVTDDWLNVMRTTGLSVVCDRCSFFLIVLWFDVFKK